MINKKKSQRWVKIVAWLLAISFGLGMTLLLAIPTPNNSNAPSPASTSTPITGSQAVAGAVGQGDLAMKSGNIDQAISFYADAYRLDKKDKSTRKKLTDAYKKYLQVLPDGPKAEQIKTALKSL